MIQIIKLEEKKKKIDNKRPTVIIPTGFDSFPEELWLTSGIEAYARGWNVVLIDGPGQGHILHQYGYSMIHDYEKVILGVLDTIENMPGVDKERIALLGIIYIFFLYIYLRFYLIIYFIYIYI